MIEIKPIRSLEDMYTVVELQHSYWGDDVEAAIPAHMLFSLANNGGHVLAAFDDETMVAALIGFLGTSEDDSRRPAMANLQLVSKRMVVLDTYRNRGLGYRLKLAQRDLAIEQGIRLISWTFNPLLSANAYLNVRKLGVTSQRFIQNYYGTAEVSGGLVTLGSSDRLVAEWWVTHRRVEERLHGSRGDLTLEHYLGAGTVIVNPTSVTDDGIALPPEKITRPASSMALLEIPNNFNNMVADNETLARHWSSHIREMFQDLMREGYMVTDFLYEPYENRQRAFYLLSYNGPQYQSFTMN
jgi:predicted GNAT superfamily acetyltransferase